MATSRCGWLCPLASRFVLELFIPTDTEIAGLVFLHSTTGSSEERDAHTGQHYSLSESNSIVPIISIRWSRLCGSSQWPWQWRRWLGSSFYRMLISLICSNRDPVIIREVDWKGVGCIRNTSFLPIRTDSVTIITKRKMDTNIQRKTSIRRLALLSILNGVACHQLVTHFSFLNIKGRQIY